MSNAVMSQGVRFAPADPPEGHSALSMDGRVLQLRLAADEDRQGLDDLFSRLSSRSVYQRFLTVSRVLTNEYAADLTDKARTLDAVLVTWQGTVVAVGSTHLVSKSAAEVALVIDDAHQGKGLGSLMLEELMARARARGLSQLVALVLADNRQMRQVLTDLGVPVRFEPQGETCAVTGARGRLRCGALGGPPGSAGLGALARTVPAAHVGGRGGGWPDTGHRGTTGS